MDLQQFRKRAYRKKGKLTAFLQKLDDVIPKDLAKLVSETDKTVWGEVDCMKCANCCKTMTPTYTPKDISRISAHLGMTSKEFKDKWLEQDPENGDWMNKKQPCQFLKNNKCSIYEVRPKDCAEFPHHNKRQFDLYNETFIQNLHRCPATFLLVDRLKKRIEDEYEWKS
jgi:Fe-S-cluster containining protein